MFVERLLLLISALAFALALIPLIPSVRLQRLAEAAAPFLFVLGLLKPLAAIAAIPPPNMRVLDVPLEPTVESTRTDTALSESNPPASVDVYRVRPGDSLWAIACRELGPGASDQDVNLRWRQIYAANRELIGSNPDMIHPGQVLSLPAVSGD